MKKTIYSVLIIALFAIPNTSKAFQTVNLNSFIFGNSVKKLNTTDPEAQLSGPYYNTPGYLTFYWGGGDTLPEGAYWAIDYAEYQSAGIAGSEGGQIDIPVSAFGSSGYHTLAIHYLHQEEQVIKTFTPFLSVYIP